MKGATIIVFFVILLSAFILIIGTTLQREPYGGPIKVIRRIPKTECNTICENYFYDCLNKTRLTDYDLCESKLNACKAICKYSNFQRL